MCSHSLHMGSVRGSEHLAGCSWCTIDGQRSSRMGCFYMLSDRQPFIRMQISLFIIWKLNSKLLIYISVKSSRAISDNNMDRFSRPWISESEVNNLWWWRQRQSLRWKCVPYWYEFSLKTSLRSLECGIWCGICICCWQVVIHTWFIDLWFHLCDYFFWI